MFLALLRKTQQVRDIITGLSELEIELIDMSLSRFFLDPQNPAHKPFYFEVSVREANWDIVMVAIEGVTFTLAFDGVDDPYIALLHVDSVVLNSLNPPGQLNQ